MIQSLHNRASSWGAHDGISAVNAKLLGRVTTETRLLLGRVTTETIKHGILITIHTSNELAFYVDSRYIKFIKSHVPIKSCEPQKICMKF